MRRTARRVMLIAAVSAVLAACGGDAEPRSLSGYELAPAPQVGALSLPDAGAGHAEFPFMATATDRLLIVYFGYTYCPDVCPTTLAEVRKAFKQLGGDRSSAVDVAMITIDPDRDSDIIIDGYVKGFLPDAHGLRTTDDVQLRATADAFGASYSVTTNDAGDVEVSHSGAMYVVDSTGTVVLTWPFGVPAAGIATDLAILLDRVAS